MTLVTGKVGCRTELLLNVFGKKFGSSSVKIRKGVSTNVLSKSNHTHGGGIDRIHAQNGSRIRLGFNLRKASFYAWVYLKKIFLKAILL